MGLVAEKIAKKVNLLSRSKTAVLDGWREGRSRALEIDISEDGLSLDKFPNCSPCHALYVEAAIIVFRMADTIAEFKEAKGFVRIVDEAEDEYEPNGPPISPLTDNYFGMWSAFDVRFGSSRETMGSCTLRIVSDFNCPNLVFNAIERLHQSRMGFYVQCGFEGSEVLLREVGTQEIISCAVPSGYLGSEGQVWFARVLPPIDRLGDPHFMITTPYVFREEPESVFVDYLEREIARMKQANRQLEADDVHYHLMKYGSEPNHWNKYIFLAYSNFQYEAIFLTGIPDIPHSLPQSPAYRRP